MSRSLPLTIRTGLRHCQPSRRVAVSMLPVCAMRHAGRLHCTCFECTQARDMVSVACAGASRARVHYTTILTRARFSLKVKRQRGSTNWIVIKSATFMRVLALEAPLHARTQSPREALCDFGTSFIDEYPDSPATNAGLDIIDKIRDRLEGSIA